MREAWIAAPRAERSDGLMAVGEVEGERIVVVDGKREVRRREMTGVWDVPPERMTFWGCQLVVIRKAVRGTTLNR